MVKIDRCVSGLDGKCHRIFERFPYFSNGVLAQLTRLLAIFPAVLDQELARACIGRVKMMIRMVRILIKVSCVMNDYVYLNNMGDIGYPQF